MQIALKELGKTLFESNEYAARNRDNHWYVYDLYKTYLRREPDAPGWAYWESVVPSNGRENVRRAFDESPEFASIVATLTPAGSPSSAVSSLATARVDPFNQPGNGLAARDAEWTVPLLSLPGRAGLDLGLSLSYSSLVWTRSGPYIYFDEDSGWPSPGFRIGFPAIQHKVFDARAGDNVYLLASSGESRVELRQLGTSSVYEAADSSYLQLIDYGGSLLVRTTDGMQMTYTDFNDGWHCTQIKDRNGNYITVNYDWLGHITTITDTLSRTITFIYDANANLISITQSWNGLPAPHAWATFGWGAATLQSSFSSVMPIGAPNGSVIPVLTQVGFDDGSRYNFEYTSGGQVNRIRRHTSDNVERAYTAYDYQTIADDCPRLSATRVAAENWTGINGLPAEVTTQFSDPLDGSHVMTAPDGTVYKEFYGSSWQKGLPTQTEVWSGGVRQKLTTLAWTQDDIGGNYQQNPRVTETNVYDAGGNRRRATTDYTSFTLPSGSTCNLPSDKREYAPDAFNPVRRTHTDYNTNSTYLDRHIIGLPSGQLLYGVNAGVETLMAKASFAYDEAGSIQGTDEPVGHDNAGYGASLLAGRANLSSTKRYDVNDVSQFAKSSMRYNTAGSVVSTTDPLLHQTSISYVESFSDGNNSRNTLAYPSAVTDADGFSSYVQYNFDFGARTRVQGPPPAGQPQGLVQTLTYDEAARIERVTTTNNGAYTRYLYGPNYVTSLATVNNVADEAYSNTVFDGLGRVTAVAGNHSSVGGYKAQLTQYDLMGRAMKQSNPTEVNGSWVPSGDDVAGWLYTQQTYDWQGRPRVTTNTDGTTKEASYSGCGCAGGEVVTLTDEGTMDAGVFKRRQQKIYSDVLGRTIKTEVLNWQGGSVYSTTVNSYDARDQLTRVLQYAGPEGGPTLQESAMTYDGYGRLKTRHLPEQDAGTATTYNYNPDDTLHSKVDARGASATYGYNGRHLVTFIVYNAPSGITVPGAVSYSYDDASNRTSMSDGLGSVSYQYNQLSRLTSEARTFSDPNNASISGVSRTLSYSYNLAGNLTSITDPFGSQVNYNLDATARVTSVTGSGFGNVSTYASNIQYRAWGEQKSVSYGDNTSATTTYNARMQPASYQLPGLREQFQYSADGRLQQMNDLDDRNQDIGFPDTARHFSRAYSFDHAGRIKTATGAPASTATFPFNQSFAYDQFNNLNSRFGSYYYQTSSTDGGTYVNNRRQGWTYHADGQVKHSGMSYDANSNETAFRDWSNDAAGRMERAKDTVTANNSISTYVTVYDGDGQSTREYLQESPVTTNSYMVRSSVWGGKVVTRLDNSGNKVTTIVPVDERLVAVQQVISGSSGVSWTHIDPLGLSQAGDTKSVFDPLGNYVPWQAAPTAPPNAYPPFSPNFGGLGSGFGTSQDRTCSLNNVPISCSDLTHQIDVGNVAADYLIMDSLGLRHVQGEVVPLGLGMSVMDYPKSDNEAWHWGETISVLPQNTIRSEYDRCRNSTFGIGATGYANKSIPTVEQTGMTFLAGRADAADSAMIAALWAHESNFKDNPGGDAGPAQLTTWWRTSHPDLIQGRAYGTWNGRTSKPFDGNVQDNIETLGNIVRFSRNRYGNLRDTPFHYGPGDSEEMERRKKQGLKGYGPSSTRIRGEYRDEVMSRYGKYKDFFDCLPHR